MQINEHLDKKERTVDLNEAQSKMGIEPNSGPRLNCIDTLSDLNGIGVEICRRSIV